MPKTTPEYVRIYQSVVDDPKFETIYDDDHHFATWVRLLMAADSTWPASCPIPSGTRKASLQALVTAGIVDVGTGQRFRIRGLDAERERRSEAGRPGGLASAHRRTTVERPLNERATNIAQRVEPAETSRDETEPSRASRAEIDDGRADLEAFLLITRRAPTERQRKLLDGLLDRHDLTGPQWAADIMLRNPADPIGALIEADKAWRAERIAEAQKAEKPKPIPRRKAGLPTHARELLAEWRRQEREKAAS